MLLHSRKTSIQELVFIAVLLLCVSFIFYRSLLFTFPSQLHAWTQSDRYALAVGFTKNGLDLFHPSTLNLQPEYKASMPLTDEKGITRVDLPLPDYLAALVMSLSGTSHPAIFRFIVLTFGLVGLLYFFALSRVLGGSLPLSLFLTLFVFSAPVFTYYLDGFIPSVPAISFAFASLWYYLQYLKTGQFNRYLVSILLLLFASLIRMPLIMPLLLLIGLQFVKNLKNKDLLIKESLLALLILSVFATSLTYNQYLGRVYGSLFLNQLMPARSVSELKSLFLETLSTWKYHYFSALQYIFVLMAFAGIVYGFMKKKLTAVVKTLLVFAFGGLLAAVLYFIAMTRQFPAHDYYFIDAFFLPLVLLILVGMHQIESLLTQKIILRFFHLTLGILLIFILLSSFNIQKNRNTTQGYDRTEITRKNYTGGEALCVEAGIGTNEKALVLDAYTYNSPLLLMNRRGYTVLNTTKENIEKSLHNNFDFIAIQNRFLWSDVLSNDPELRLRLRPIANNGRLGLYRYTNATDELVGKDPTGIGNQKKIVALKSANSMHQQNSDSFFKLADTVLNLTETGELLVYFETEAIQSVITPIKMQLVMDLSDNDNKVNFSYYDAFDLAPYFKNTGPKAKIEVILNVPDKRTQNIRYKIYLWNRGGNDLTYKNLKLDLIQYTTHLIKTNSNEKH